MEYTKITVSKDARGVALLELNNPDKRNVLCTDMIAELTHFGKSVTAGGDIRVVVLSGRGKVFCAGGDLSWMKMLMAADDATRKVEVRKLAMMLQAINEISVPVIGKIHGGAFGGGVGIACVCDTVIADEKAKFGLTETRLGLTPATISPYVVGRMGEGNARQVIMSARVFDGAEASRLGIVSRSCPAEKLDDAIAAEVEPYLKTAPRAVAATKAMTRLLGTQISAEKIDASIDRLTQTLEGQEADEGISAFFEGRAPSWSEH